MDLEFCYLSSYDVACVKRRVAKESEDLSRLLTVEDQDLESACKSISGVNGSQIGRKNVMLGVYTLMSPDIDLGGLRWYLFALR